MSKNVKIFIFAALMTFLTGASFVLPVKMWLIMALEWVQGLGGWGPVIVVMFYIAASVLFLPGSVITLGTGFIFKVVEGSIIVSIGSTLGACAAFWVGRTFARDWITRKVEGNAKFSAIDRAVASEGFKIVLLLRLSPVFPFNLLNYAFGLTRTGFWKYAAASWIGMMPGTVMYVYLGAGLRSLADAASGGSESSIARQLFFFFGMAATIIAAILISRIARKALEAAV